jgi:hypothetical protein
MYFGRRKIRHILENGLRRGFAAGVYLSKGQNNEIPPSPTVYIYTVYLFTQGKRGGVDPERRLEGQHFTKQVRKYQHD